MTTEAQVVGGERPICVADATKVVGDPLVIPNLVIGMTRNIVAKETEVGRELLENDSLSLDLADLLGNDPLGHLLEDEKTLLNDFNGLGMANELVLFNNGLGELRVDEVARTEEVVETVHGGDAIPVVE